MPVFSLHGYPDTGIWNTGIRVWFAEHALQKMRSSALMLTNDQEETWLRLPFPTLWS